MSYEIEIYYETGDSFGSENVTENLPYQWEDLEVAKAAIKQIKEHTEAAKQSESSRYRTPKDFFDVKEVEDKSWFHMDQDYGNWKEAWKYSIKLPIDSNGEMMAFQAFWVGYFERIISVKIVIETDEDMEILF